MAEEENTRVRHERSDFYLRGPLLVSLAVLGVTLLSMSGLWILYEDQLKELEQHSIDRSRQSFLYGPEHQAAIQETREDMRQDNQREVHGTRWIDREKQLLSIPLEAAMEAVMSQGLPEFDDEAAAWEEHRRIVGQRADDTSSQNGKEEE